MSHGVLRARMSLRGDGRGSADSGGVQRHVLVPERVHSTSALGTTAPPATASFSTASGCSTSEPAASKPTSGAAAPEPASAARAGVCGSSVHSATPEFSPCTTAAVTATSCPTANTAAPESAAALAAAAFAAASESSAVSTPLAAATNVRI